MGPTAVPINTWNDIVNELVSIRKDMEVDLYLLKSKGIVLPENIRLENEELSNLLINMTEHRDRLQESYNREVNKSWWRKLIT